MVLFKLVEIVQDTIKVEIQRAKIHDDLGMKLDFAEEAGKVHVSQDGHIKDIIETWPEKLKPTDIVKTLAPTNLFDRGGGGLLGKTEKELFHTLIMKSLFVAKCSRPGILPTT